jgi:glycosyltransferase involved in cell wall biosynthesis
MQLRTGILTIAYYYDPAGAVGALRPRRFHKYLRELGYDSRVIGALVNSAEADPSVTHIPDSIGELWDRRFKSISQGQQPERLPLAGQVERLIRKTLMPGHSGWTWSRQVARYGADLLKRNEPIRTVISSYPVIGTHLAAFHLARKAGIRWVADFRDPFPSEVPRLAQRSQDFFERQFFRQADAIIANTEPMASVWRERHSWAAHKIHVIWNGYDPEDEVKPLPTCSHSQKRIVHTGNLYAGRNANVLIETVGRLRLQAAPAADSIRIVLAGPVADNAGVDSSLYERAVQEGWLEFNQSSIPKPQALRMVQEADGLLLLQPQSAVQVPAKLFEYTSVGRPILALAPEESSIEWILQRAGLPYVCVHPSDSAETADAKLLRFLAIPNRPSVASDWFRQNFNARGQAERLAEIIEDVNRPRR